MSAEYVLAAFPETGRDRSVLKALTAVAGFVAVMVAWSVLAEIPEVAKTRGEVLPVGGDVHEVQSLAGGKILKIFVAEGDMVEQGQMIASLDQTVSVSDINRLEVQHSDLLMQIERHTALIADRKPDFGSYRDQYPGMVREQKELFVSERELMISKEKIIAGEIKTRDRELTSETKQLAEIKKAMAIVKKELDIYKKALKTGSVSEQQSLEKQERYATLNKDLEQSKGKISSLKSELENLKEKKKKTVNELKTEYRGKRAELVEALHELEQELIKAHSSVGQNALLAPFTGVVKTLNNSNIGSVVQPGGVVAEIVPSDLPLQVDVRISPRDIGFIAVGQEVFIKVDAYDYSRFGAIKGQVVRISPSTFKDEQTGQPYFKATIDPESEHLGNEQAGRKISVGMTVEADITTGHKTVFQYLLKPIYTTMDTAFSER